MSELEAAERAALAEAGQCLAAALRRAAPGAAIGHTVRGSRVIAGAASAALAAREVGSAGTVPSPALARATAAAGPEIARRIGERLARAVVAALTDGLSGGLTSGRNGGF